MRRQLAIFAKVPQLGQVKRRLAAEIGAVAAWRFHRATLAALLCQVARDPRWRATVWRTPDRFASTKFATVRVLQCAQGHGDLGARMRRAFLAKGRGPVVLVGSDIPALGPKQIRDAFRALGRNDLVFGPAKDGGYWLIASARRRGRMPPLKPVRWSSKHALADTRACFDRRHKVAFLETLEDVDDSASYRRWRKRGRS